MAKLVKKLKHTKQELKNMAEEYIQIGKKMKLLESTKKMLSDKIKEASEELGIKDDRGSFYCESDGFITGKVANKSVKLDEEKAINLFKEKGLYDKIVEKKTIEVINEDTLEECINEGLISMDEFESICNVKVTYKVSVKETQEMPEVEKTTLKAASKK